MLLKRLYPLGELLTLGTGRAWALAGNPNEHAGWGGMNGLEHQVLGQVQKGGVHRSHRSGPPGSVIDGSLTEGCSLDKQADLFNVRKSSMQWRAEQAEQRKQLLPPAGGPGPTILP